MYEDLHNFSLFQHLDIVKAISDVHSFRFLSIIAAWFVFVVA
jgi:hypothetical protein